MQGKCSHRGLAQTLQCNLVVTVSATSIVYYVEGRKVAQHDGRYLPERPMSINFNQGLISFTGQIDKRAHLRSIGRATSCTSTASSHRIK